MVPLSHAGNTQVKSFSERFGSFASGFLAGGYLTGAAFTFVGVGFFVVLGGNSADLWKPFAAALAWPLAIPYIIIFGR